MDDLHKIQQISNLYALVERRHYIPGTNRREDDSIHSYSVALICWYFYDKLKLRNKLSQSKILKYALAHDIVEIYAGDVVTYASKEDLAKKKLNESKSIIRLEDELSFFPDIIQNLADYHNSTDEESLFVWTCDKIQAYTQGQIDSWRPYRELPVTKSMFVIKIEEHLTKASPYMLEEFQELANAWISDYPEDI